MTISIRKKLILIYIILILIPLILVNYWAVSNMKETVLGEIEVNTLKTANIIANLSRDNFNEVVSLKRITRQYIPPLGGRIIILDIDREVLADRFNLLEGNNINNLEIKNALEGREKLGYYQKDQPILQVGVPVTRLVDGSRQVIGVVLISTSVLEPFQQIGDFQRQLIYISMVAASLGWMGAIIAGSGITKPLLALSKAAKNIGEGNLGETVQITSRDEIGRLAHNFNQMSRELHRIDCGRTQFIGDVSHELKTPLASMKALIDSLLYGENDLAVYREYLRDMDSEIDRLTQLIKSLLKLTKLEEQGMEFKENSLEDLVGDAVKILRPLMEQSGVMISVEISPKVNLVCHGERIKEVLINLIDNAIKYKDSLKEFNQVLITGKIEKDTYIIRIKDNGVGISKEDLGSVFDKFYRIDSSRSRDTGGAGIGLSIVERILKVHQWKILVESQSNLGTTFMIIVPKGSFNLSS